MLRDHFRNTRYWKKPTWALVAEQSPKQPDADLGVTWVFRPKYADSLVCRRRCFAKQASHQLGKWVFHASAQLPPQPCTWKDYFALTRASYRKLLCRTQVGHLRRSSSDVDGLLVGAKVATGNRIFATLSQNVFCDPVLVFA